MEYDHGRAPAGAFVAGAVIVLASGWFGWNAVKRLGRVLSARRADSAQEVSPPQATQVLSKEGGVDTAWADPGNR